MRQQLVQDADYARALADALVPILAHRDFPDLPVTTEDEDEAPGAEVNIVETFAEAGVLGRDGGLVLHMSDGATVHMSIQALVPRGAR